MDHSDAVRLKATERYLLNELDPDQLDQFEEHLFDCPDCAVDVRAAAMFLEQSKTLLSEVRGPELVKTPAPVHKGWLDWLRPAFAAPMMALLLAVVGYQNLVAYPRLQRAVNTPQVLPWASVNVGTWGANGPVIPVPPGKGFLLFVRIPPEGAFTHYAADLYDPSGKLEWSLSIPVTSSQDQRQDQWTVQVPGANRASGTYTLAVRGTTTTGETRDIGRTSFDLKIQQ
jgi:Putative zinc-finger